MKTNYYLLALIITSGWSVGIKHGISAKEQNERIKKILYPE